MRWAWRSARAPTRGLVRPRRRAGQRHAPSSTCPPRPSRRARSSPSRASRTTAISLLRRQLGADGRSRAFVNDQPVGVGLLRRARRRAGRDPGPVRAASGCSTPRPTASCSTPSAASSRRRERSARPGAPGGQRRAARAAAEAAPPRRGATRTSCATPPTELTALAPKPGEEADARRRAQPAAATAQKLRRGARRRRWTSSGQARAAPSRRIARGAAPARPRSPTRPAGRLDAALAALDRALTRADRGGGRSSSRAGTRSRTRSPRGWRRSRSGCSRCATSPASTASPSTSCRPAPSASTPSWPALDDRQRPRSPRLARRGRRPRAPGLCRRRRARCRRPARKARGAARQGGRGRAAAAEARQGALRHRARAAARGAVGPTHGTRPRALRGRHQSRRAARPARRASPRAASCRASCWRSRSCWPGGRRRCRPWSSTRSTAASAAPPPPRSASGWRASASDVQVLVVTHSPQVAARGRPSLAGREDAAGKSRQSTRVARARRARAGARRSPACCPAPTVTDEARAAADRLMAAGQAAPMHEPPKARRATLPVDKLTEAPRRSRARASGAGDRPSRPALSPAGRAGDLRRRLRRAAPAQRGDRGALSRAAPRRQPERSASAPRRPRGFAKVPHARPMLSLDNAFEERTCAISSPASAASSAWPTDARCRVAWPSPRSTGCRPALRYEDGGFVPGRHPRRRHGGRGRHRQSADHRRTCPTALEGQAVPTVLEVRGEVYMRARATSGS